LRILMLGTGAAMPDPDRTQTAILVTLDNGRHYMFDCGHGATRQMVRADVNPADVGWVFLTHLHHDHTCDLPFFIISSWILNRIGAPLLLGPKGTRRLVDHLLENGAFQADFRARAAYPVRQANLEAMRPEVREIVPGLVYEDEHIRVHADHVDHIPREICECYGVRIEAEGKVVTFSGDTKPCEAMSELARDADLLIHECSFPESFIEHRRRTGVGTFAHTSPRQLGEIATKARVKDLVVTHFGHFDSLSPVLRRAAGNHFPVDEMGPHQLDTVIADIRRGYSGRVRLAHDLMRIDL
jgi:ribonuclease Z